MGGGGRDSARVDFVITADPRWSPFVNDDVTVISRYMTSSLGVADLKGNTFGSTV